jgi:uncharacterized protein (DUF2062 family)
LGLRNYFKLPTRHELKEQRWTRLFGPRLHDPMLWRIRPEPAARGLAIGLFLGILIPLGQFVFAAIAAIALRVNLPMALAGTLVSNPFTTLGIYYLSYRIGELIMVADTGMTTPSGEAMQRFLQAKNELGWLQSWSYMLDWLQAAGWPLIVGLLTLACAAALIGYFACLAILRIYVAVRMNRRQRRMEKKGQS